MNILQALGLGRRSSEKALREKLPALNALVEMSIARGRSGSVSVDALGPKTFTTTALPGLTPQRVAVFVYSTAQGKYRFSARCVSVNGTQAAFEIPTRIETLAKFDGAQKRSDVRLDTTVIAHWRYAPGGRGTGDLARCSITDLSRTGVSLIIDRDLKKGTQVEVRFALNTATAPLVILGEVMRASKVANSLKSSLGLRFHGVSKADDRAIMDFINKRQTERRSRGFV